MVGARVLSAAWLSQACTAQVRGNRRIAVMGSMTSIHPIPIPSHVSRRKGRPRRRHGIESMRLRRSMWPVRCKGFSSTRAESNFSDRWRGVQSGVGGWRVVWVGVVWVGVAWVGVAFSCERTSGLCRTVPNYTALYVTRSPHAHMHTCTHAHMHTCICTGVHIHTHTCSCTCTYTRFPGRRAETW